MNKIKAFYQKYSDIILPTAVLIAICIVVTLALSGANLLTRGPIAEITEKNNNAAMQKVLKAQTYEEYTVEYDNAEYNYNIAKNGEETAGYVFITAEKGYGGDVSVMTAIGTDGKIIAVEILDVSGETPGLGQNAAKPNFYEQFIGVSDKTAVVKSGADRSLSQIDAVTGATISSRAVSNAVNKAVDISKIILTEGGDAQ